MTFNSAWWRLRYASLRFNRSHRSNSFMRLPIHRPWTTFQFMIIPSQKSQVGTVTHIQIRNVQKSNKTISIPALPHLGPSQSSCRPRSLTKYYASRSLAHLSYVICRAKDRLNSRRLPSRRRRRRRIRKSLWSQKHRLKKACRQKNTMRVRTVNYYTARSSTSI